MFSVVKPKSIPMRPIQLEKRFGQLVCVVCLTLFLLLINVHQDTIDYSVASDTGRNGRTEKKVTNIKERGVMLSLDKNSFWIKKGAIDDGKDNTEGGYLNTGIERNLQSVQSESRPFMSLQNIIKPSQEFTNSSGIFTNSSQIISYSSNISKSPSRKAKKLRKRPSQLYPDSSSYTAFKNVTIAGFPIYLYSAVVGNSSRQRNTTWDRIVIQGFEDKALHNQTYVCCVLYESGTLTSFEMLSKVHWYKRVQLGVKQFICPNKPPRKRDSPVRVTLSTSHCHERYELYVPTELAYRNAGKIGVCTKLAYGSLPADDIISWFEVHKLLGVSKVLTYTYHLNKKARRALRHYQKEGIAEVFQFAFPPYVRGSKWQPIGAKNAQGWNDEQLAVYDCLERLKGYAYIATIDFDEYLVPTKHKTLGGMMKRLLRYKPDAAGFTFFMQLHVTSWEPRDNSTLIKIGRYLDRTEAMTDRMKHLTLPGRLNPGGLGTHSFSPRLGFHKRACPLAIGTLHHFRRCRTEWVEKNSTRCNELPRYRDDSVAKLYKKVESKILSIKSELVV